MPRDVVRRALDRAERGGAGTDTSRASAVVRAGRDGLRSARIAPMMSAKAGLLILASRRFGVRFLRISSVLLGVLAAAPAAAQEAGDPSLAERMRDFLLEVKETPNTGLAAYFPRRGDWTWVQAVHDARSGVRVGTGTWRFPGAETPRVIGDDGPACDSFDRRSGVGPHEGRFGMQASLHRGPWRRVRGNRFVPPGEPANAPVFVEWRREDGRWVVSAFGDNDVSFPRLLGRPAGPFSPDTAGIPEDAAFARADWYTVTIDGRRFARYGEPRPLSEAERATLARIGVLHGVSVFSDRRRGVAGTGIVYLLAGPGRFQPYETHVGVPCR